MKRKRQTVLPFLRSLFIFPHAGPDIKYSLGFLRTQLSTSVTIFLVFGPKVPGKADSSFTPNRSTAQRFFFFFFSGDSGPSRTRRSMGQPGASSRRHREFLAKRNRLGARRNDRSLSGERGTEGPDLSSISRRIISRKALHRGNVPSIFFFFSLALFPGRDTKVGGSDRVHEDRSHGDAQQAHQAQSRWIFQRPWSHPRSSFDGAKSDSQELDRQFYFKSMYLSRPIIIFSPLSLPVLPPLSFEVNDLGEC